MFKLIKQSRLFSHFSSQEACENESSKAGIPSPRATDTGAGQFFAVGIVLCVVGCLPASLASTHEMCVTAFP